MDIPRVEVLLSLNKRTAGGESNEPKQDGTPTTLTPSNVATPPPQTVKPTVNAAATPPAGLRPTGRGKPYLRTDISGIVRDNKIASFGEPKESFESLSV